MNYASFWSRLLAGLIDTVVLLIPSIIIVALFEPEFYSGPENHTDNPVTYFLLAGLWAIYQGGMESSRHQATLGKKLVKAYVSDTQGGRLSFSTAAIRCWPMYLPNLMIGLGAVAENSFQIEVGTSLTSLTIVLPVVSCIYIFQSDKNQGLHDWASGTLVLRKQKENNP